MHKLTRTILATWLIILIGSISCYAATTKKLTQYANLAAAISAVGSDDVNLVIDKNDTLTANLTIPSNVHCLWIHDAIVTTDGNTLTFNYAPDIGLFQAFNAAAGEVVFAVGTVDTVYAEWWGAVAKTSKATAIDCTTAIRAAVATGRDVQLLDGYYGYNTDSDVLAVIKHEGQKVRGKGKRLSDDNGGTYMYKISGTHASWKTGAYLDIGLHDMTLDGNSLAGNLLQMHGTYYSEAVKNVHFAGQGGTDYAFYCQDSNHNTYRDLSFGSDNYAGIYMSRTTAAGYSSFYNTIMGETSSNIAIYFGDYLTGLNFYHTTVEGAIIFQGRNESISFDGLTWESAVNDRPLVSINSTDTRNISFKNVRLYQSAATTYPKFSVVGARTFEVNSMYVRDAYSGAGVDVFDLDGTYGVAIRSVFIYTGYAMDFIDSTGSTGLNYHPLIENCDYASGAATPIKLKSSRATVRNSNMPIAFVAGCDSNTLIESCSGTITMANNGGQVVIINGREPADYGNGSVAGLTFGILSNGRVHIPYYQQDAEPVIPLNSIAKWQDTDAGPKYYLIGNFNTIQAKIELTP